MPQGAGTPVDNFGINHLGLGGGDKEPWQHRPECLILIRRGVE